MMLDCPDSPNGNHCWHEIRDGEKISGQKCCYCDKTYRKGGIKVETEQDRIIASAKRTLAHADDAIANLQMAIQQSRETVRIAQEILQECREAQGR